MKIIGIVNQKGGVAKTTTASALAYGLARRGKKVLLIDFDPQGNLTTSCGVSVDENNPPVLSFLLYPKNNVVPYTLEDRLDFIGSGIELETANMVLAGKPCRELYLKRALKAVDGQYDYVIIDSNPSLSVITLNVFSACDDIVVPFKPEFNSEKGVELLIYTVEEIRQINAKLRIRGLLATMADKRRNSTEQSIAHVEEYAKACGSKVYASRIRQSVVAADAPMAGVCVYDYRPTSPLVADYANFVEEFLKEEK